MDKRKRLNELLDEIELFAGPHKMTGTELSAIISKAIEHSDLSFYQKVGYLDVIKQSLVLGEQMLTTKNMLKHYGN